MLIRPNFRELMENSPAAIPLVIFVHVVFSFLFQISFPLTAQVV
jgi:hypothetical protein